MNKCTKCNHESDYNIRCFMCGTFYDTRQAQEFNRKVNLVLSDPRFTGNREQAEDVVCEVS